jgi:hypothetical protein
MARYLAYILWPHTVAKYRAIEGPPRKASNSFFILINEKHTGLKFDECCLFISKHSLSSRLLRINKFCVIARD